MKTVQCAAGEWTVLTRSIAAGMPAFYPLEFPEDVQGEYRVHRGLLPFGWLSRPPVVGRLEPRMEFSRGWFDAFFKVEVRPEAEIIVKFL